jgi:hypothetical protein
VKTPPFGAGAIRGRVVARRYRRRYPAIAESQRLRDALCLPGSWLNISHEDTPWARARTCSMVEVRHD